MGDIDWMGVFRLCWRICICNRLKKGLDGSSFICSTRKIIEWQKTNLGANSWPPSVKSIISATTKEPLGSRLISTPFCLINANNPGLAAARVSSRRAFSSFLDVLARMRSVAARAEMIAGVKCLVERGMMVYNNERRPAALERRADGMVEVGVEGIISEIICFAVSFVSLRKN